MKNKIFTDSLALSCVKIFTMASSILSTMVLSKSLSLDEYGTYSTANLIITTTTLISAFGLIDAVNFYYNGKSIENREKYVNTVFSIITTCGILAGLFIILVQDYLTVYFHNNLLNAIYIYIAFRPLIENLSLGFQNLQVSIGKAKIVAIRNLIVSFTKLFSVIITTAYTKNILTIFKIILFVDIISLIFFYKVLKDNGVKIDLFNVDVSKMSEILMFCIPLGLYIQTAALSRDLDKYIIGFFETTEKLAIYTNCSTKLPFDLVSGPLVVLLIPLLTKCIHQFDYKNSIQLFRSYIKTGYISTLSFGFGIILVASEAIKLLYGPKYLSGIVIFILYIFIDMLNFISYSLVLSAKGQTKELMIVSCIGLIMNGIINILLYNYLGFIGPAIATVLITLAINFVLLCKSATILNVKVRSLFDFQHLVKFFLEIVLLFCVFGVIKIFMLSLGVHYFIIIVIVGGGFVLSLLLLNIVEIKKSFTTLNYINKNIK